MTLLEFKIRSAVYLGVLAIIIVYGSFKFSNLRLPFRLLLLLLIVTFVEEFIIKTLMLVGVRYAFLYHIYLYIEYMLFGIIFFYMGLSHYKWSKSFIGYSMILFFIFCDFNTIYLQPVSILPSYAIIVSSVLYVFQTLMIYSYMLNNPTKIPLYKQGLFWFVTGCFIFYPVSFFIFSSEELIQHNKLVDILHNILFSINIIMYLCFGIAIFMEARNNKQHFKIK